MDNNQYLKLFVKISQQRMYNHYLPKLVQSVQVLDSDAIWSKEAENLNSVGGIVLHICEHVRRISIKFSVRNHAGFNEGIEDYFPNLNLSPEELLQTVKETFDEFNSVMEKLIENMPDEIDMHSLYHLVEHTGYHLGQIVDRSKRITKKSFNFCQNGINEQNLKALIKEQ
ncbi:hypothetical protein ACNR9V_03730 [Parageobacillus thermoglucosidasius]|uniref:hypothetical protein n=1 Tax=Parageobacillus thermoglucosidasius TaxID=1426 RepID=UPI000F61EC06|nr:hypothetical protein [Parageobacillus thermoglucosidasius]GCD81389.1 hypothetical protein PTHTG4_04510 [Parageobacillus thermoglucosidasius]